MCLKKNFIAILFISFFMVGYTYAQEKIYFLIDKNDTLIKKQIATEENKPEGYLILSEGSEIPLKTSLIKEGKVWVPESDGASYISGQWFQFFRQNDKLITEDEFLELDVIKKRREFLKISKVPFDLSNTSYFFIERMECRNKYILREVFPVVYE